LKDELVFRPTTTGFFHEGSFYPFTYPQDLLGFAPISPSERLKLGMQILKWRRLKDWNRLDDISAKEWLLSQMDEKTYRIIWHPLLAIKFGAQYDRISAAWLWHRIHRVANSRKSPLRRQVMGYFRDGTETFLHRLRERILGQGSRIFCNAPVLEWRGKPGAPLPSRFPGKSANTNR